MLPLVLPVTLAGAAAVVAAAVFYPTADMRGWTTVGLLALLAASVVAEALPVPIQGVHVGATSLATIFIAGAAVLYGWAPAVLLAFATMMIVELHRRRPPHARRLQRGALLALRGRGRLGRRHLRRPRRPLGAPARAGARRAGLLPRRHRAPVRGRGALDAGERGRHLQPLPADDRGAVRDHGLGHRAARRGLGPLGAADRRARRTARRDRALPALGAPRARGDASRPNRSAHRPRQPARLRRAAAARARDGARRGTAARALHDRRRRLQADQRHPRPRHRRQRPRGDRGAASPHAARRSASAGTSSRSSCPAAARRRAAPPRGA